MQAWVDKLLEQNPKLRESRTLYEERKKNNGLQLWERCRLGEVFPTKVYEPVEAENPRCELCGDVGYRFYWQDGYHMAEECECLGRIQAEEKMRKAGVDRNMTFDTFCLNQPWQEEMSAKAMEYALGGYLSGQWFFAGGQVGCGKTHICTAIVNELTKSNIGCRYMTWREESVQLKALVNEHQEYHDRIMELCNAPVLYIDDLFKTQAGMRPTQADVNLAFQILNHRYQDKKWVTIISTEYTTAGLIAIDEAVGSRIYERSKAYRVEIEKDMTKNYRLKMG